MERGREGNIEVRQGETLRELKTESTKRKEYNIERQRERKWGGGGGGGGAAEGDRERERDVFSATIISQILSSVCDNFQVTN